MDVVLDCSFTASLFLPDESSDACRRKLLRLKDADTIRVPALWWIETANVVTVARRRKRLGEADVRHALSMLDGLEPVTDAAIGPEHLQQVHLLAENYGLSAYDAAYLELAVRYDARVGSLDGDLLKAVAAAGLKVL